MGKMQTTPLPLANRQIALPEKRELDVLAGLLERRGANIYRCPLVSIKDSRDTKSIGQWLQRFLRQPPDWMIFMTGEGVRRLSRFADHQLNLRQEFIDALKATQILCRGPKPVRVLRKMGVKPTLLAHTPTTPGVIQSLSGVDLALARVAVQMYGQDPNPLLIDYLNLRRAKVDAVAPYVYVEAGEDDEVIRLIENVIAGRMDAIAFTSKAQVARLFNIAGRAELIDDLCEALKEIHVAAIGPIVADQLIQYGVASTITPSDRFFMKPLVSAMVARMGPVPNQSKTSTDH